MQKTLSASLYEDDNPNESSGDRVEIKDGLVTFEQRDYNTPDAFDKFSGFICNNHLEIRCILRLI